MAEGEEQFSYYGSVCLTVWVYVGVGEQLCKVCLCGVGKIFVNAAGFRVAR